MIPIYQGIDVSNLDDNLKWADIILNTYPDFILLEIGKSTNNQLKINNYFWQDYNWLKKHEILIGAFWESGAKDKKQFDQEIKLLSNLLQTQNFQFDFPIYYKNNIKSIDKFEQTKNIKKVLDYFNNCKIPMGFGCSFDQLNNNLNYTQLVNYSLWISQEDTSCTSKLPYDIWQYKKQIMPNINLNYTYNLINQDLKLK